MTYRVAVVVIAGPLPALAEESSMTVSTNGDAARPDARLIPLLDHLAKLLAADCQREAQAGASDPLPRLALPRKAGT